MMASHPKMSNVIHWSGSDLDMRYLKALKIILIDSHDWEVVACFYNKVLWGQ